MLSQSQVDYFRNVDATMRSLGDRILTDILRKSKFLDTSTRLWNANDPHKGNDRWAISSTKTLPLFETFWKFYDVRFDDDYLKSVDIDPAVFRFTTTIDNLIEEAVNLAFDPKRPDYRPAPVFLSRPYPNPTYDMSMFSVRCRYLIRSKDELGITLLCATDEETHFPAIWVRLVALAFVS
jgi:hypothetical protein